MNHSGTLHLRDQDFRQEHAEECELLFRVNKVRLSYAVLNTRSGKLQELFDTVLFSPLAETLRGIISQDDHLSYNYKRVKIATETFNFTFIPSEFYSEHNLPLYHNFIVSSLPEVKTVNAVSEGNLYSIAGIDQEIVAPLLQQYSEARIYSQAEALIEGLLKYPAEKKKLILQFNTGTFEAALASGNELLFYNIFTAATPHDLNYFLLQLIQQLALNTSEISVLLAGEIEKHSENYRRVIKYFNHVSFAGSAEDSYTEAFRLVPPHQFFSLISLGLCV